MREARGRKVGDLLRVLSRQPNLPRSCQVVEVFLDKILEGALKNPRVSRDGFDRWFPGGRSKVPKGPAFPHSCVLNPDGTQFHHVLVAQLGNCTGLSLGALNNQVLQRDTTEEQFELLNVLDYDADHVQGLRSRVVSYSALLFDQNTTSECL